MSSSINNLGQVVGTLQPSNPTGGGVWHVFLHQLMGQIIDLGTCGGPATPVAANPERAVGAFGNAINDGSSKVVVRSSGTGAGREGIFLGEVPDGGRFLAEDHRLVSLLGLSRSFVADQARFSALVATVMTVARWGKWTS